MTSERDGETGPFATGGIVQGASEGNDAIPVFLTGCDYVPSTRFDSTVPERTP